MRNARPLIVNTTGPHHRKASPLSKTRGWKPWEGKKPKSASPWDGQEPRAIPEGDPAPRTQPGEGGGP
jgi:hypothetical protein